MCAGNMNHRLTARDTARPECRDEYSLIWCDRCEFGQIAETFNSDEISAFYPSNYYTRSTYQGPSLSIPQRAIIHLAWRFDNGTDFQPSDLGWPGAACDIGCGAGDNMRRMRDAGFCVTGIDPDPQALSRASAYGSTFLGTAETIPAALEGKQFDSILMMHSLEHCVDPQRALQTVAALLKQNGAAIIEVPNNACVGLSRYGARWPYSDIPRHLHFFTPKSLAAMGASAGLKATKTCFTGYVRQFYPNWLRRIGRNGLLHFIDTFRLPPEQKYDSVRVRFVRA